MTEISYIIQDGEQINLKDAKGRELLAEKQVKLKAGRGISIANDGTISVIGSGSSATGFFINASGDFNNLTFDKTPVEVNAAIEQGNIIIVNANNAKFILTDVKDGTYLFSYLVVSGEEDCLAQMATISATSNEGNWSEIKTNFVSIKTAQKEEGSALEDKYHEDDDLGVDFSDWSEYREQDNLEFYEDRYGQRAYYVDENGNEVSESTVNQYGNENSEVTSRIQGIAFYNYYDSEPYINQHFVKDNDGVLELDVIRFKDGFNVAIEDGELQGQLPNYQDTLIIGEGLEISEDGTISIKE
jgi:hypothetical protein